MTRLNVNIVGDTQRYLQICHTISVCLAILCAIYLATIDSVPFLSVIAFIGFQIVVTQVHHYLFLNVFSYGKASLYIDGNHFALDPIKPTSKIINGRNVLLLDNNIASSARPPRDNFSYGHLLWVICFNFMTLNIIKLVINPKLFLTFYVWSFIELACYVQATDIINYLMSSIIRQNKCFVVDRNSIINYYDDYCLTHLELVSNNINYAGTMTNLNKYINYYPHLDNKNLTVHSSVFSCIGNYKLLQTLLDMHKNNNILINNYIIGRDFSVYDYLLLQISNNVGAGNNNKALDNTVTINLDQLTEQISYLSNYQVSDECLTSINKFVTMCNREKIAIQGAEVRKLQEFIDAKIARMIAMGIDQACKEIVSPREITYIPNIPLMKIIESME